MSYPIECLLRHVRFSAGRFEETTAILTRLAARHFLILALLFCTAWTARARVIINEIHYNPDVKTDLTEFVELYNSGTETVSLAGWQLSGAVNFTFWPGWVINPGAYVVVAQQPSSIWSKYGISPAGPWQGTLSNDGETITLKNAAGGVEHQVNYKLGFPWPTVGDPPTRSIQLVNSAFDADLGGNWRAAAPTPGKANSAVAATNLPPAVRQVDHTPNQPVSGQPVTITAKVSDPEGVASVSLQYQPVAPGNYIEMTDPEYSTTWTTLTMNDAGINGDAQAGDSIYTAIIPASVQKHRWLIRYRITAKDKTGLSITAPYSDDPQPNFAYFCYDGVPAWQGAAIPGSTSVTTFGTNVMRHLPSLHLIAKNQSVYDCTWGGGFWGTNYPWSGTLVLDGKVYDHIHYRPRGGVWRYSMVKNMWKFDFNRGHDLQMCDDYGRKYSAPWRKLNLGACIQQGDYGHRGEQGMFESVGFRLFNLVGVPAARTTFLQLRIIDDPIEADPTTQYEGDFWGLYLAVEQMDGRFLDEHDLPDGNLFKMESGSGPSVCPNAKLNNVGLYGPSDYSDMNTFLRGGSADSWWTANFDLNTYYSYRTVVEGIHHYDIGSGKNYFYYHNPTNGIWSVHPWDLDLTWANNMYGNGGEPFKTAVLGRAAFNAEYKNRIREIRDLLFNTNEVWKLIDEHARLLRGTNGGPNFLDADRAMWDYNPAMQWSGKAGQGRFYLWPNESVSRDFEGCITLMKNYVKARSSTLDSLASDTTIPSQPSISYSGPSGYPANKLAFQASAYKGANAFAAMKWRVAEVTDPKAPLYNPADPILYEINAAWESPELSSYTSTFTIPSYGIKPGHAYRARVRMKDNTGRWSNWSAPVQFIAGQPDNAAALVSNLRITELMYNPPAGSDYEYIELHNSSANLPLSLAGVAFTSGVDYTFPQDVSLPPDGYLLVIKNASADTFRSYYGLDTTVAVAGPYSGSFANNGEQVTLKTTVGGLTIASFTYSDGYAWPKAAAGAGHSLVPVHPDAAGQDSGALDYPGNWRASAFVNGSPGTQDPETPAPDILLNEVVANTDSDPLVTGFASNDWIELFNVTDSSVTLAGWYLTDDPATPKKWAIPLVTIAPRDHVVFDEITGFHTTLFGFGLDKTGEQVLLSRFTGEPTDRVVDSVAFKGQDNFVTLGRYPDGAPYWERTVPTRNNQNALQAAGLCITEVMYHPPDIGTNDNTRDEYIKITNPTANAIKLQDTNGVWRLAGGVGFQFPTNTVIPPGGSILVVNFDPAEPLTLNAFRTAYKLNYVDVRYFGPYTGKLSNRSDRVALERPKYPEAAGLPYWWVLIDEVIYGNQDPWPSSANGTGSSLQRRSVSQTGNDPANWIASTPNPGSLDTDYDGDGMPDQWEIAHFLNPYDPYDAALDSDDDGLSNLNEFLCGTDPRDPQSRLSFDSVERLSAGFRLRFTAMPNRSYTILTSDTLTSGSWVKLTNVPSGTELHSTEVIDSQPESSKARFYQLVTPALP